MKLKNPIGYMISNTGRKVSYHLTSLFEPYGVTSEQWSIMLHLHEENGITHKELSTKSEKDRANVTRLVDQLERKELLNRVDNPEDRRSIRLYLTEKGKEIVLALIPIEQAFIENLLANVTAEEIAQFTKIMNKLTSNVERRIE